MQQHTKLLYTHTLYRLEVEAKLPRGDWIWPAVWLLPEDDAYGRWPASGEIDMLESRGNRYMCLQILFACMQHHITADGVQKCTCADVSTLLISCSTFFALKLVVAA
jgi:beta-glucanase (GH16 family)